MSEQGDDREQLAKAHTRFIGENHCPPVDMDCGMKVRVQVSGKLKVKVTVKVKLRVR